MADRYADAVDFYVVYIREAHPEDGWVLNINRDQDIAFDDPTDDAGRERAASACALNLKITMPVVIDPIDDRVASAYGALPDRLYLISRGGTVAYQGGPGPVGFNPGELDDAIKTELARISS